MVHLCGERSPSYRCLAREGDKLQGVSGCGGPSQVSEWLLAFLCCVSRAEATELSGSQSPHQYPGMAEEYQGLPGGAGLRMNGRFARVVSGTESMDSVVAFIL